MPNQKPRDIWSGPKLRELKRLADEGLDANEITNHFFEQGGVQEWDEEKTQRELDLLEDVLKNGPLMIVVIDELVADTIKEMYAEGRTDEHIHWSLRYEKGFGVFGGTTPDDIKQVLQHWKYYDTIQVNSGPALQWFRSHW